MKNCTYFCRKAHFDEVFVEFADTLNRGAKNKERLAVWSARNFKFLIYPKSYKWN
jgi:hypothetical protein